LIARLSNQILSLLIQFYSSSEGLKVQKGIGSNLIASVDYIQIEEVIQSFLVYMLLLHT